MKIPPREIRYYRHSFFDENAIACALHFSYILKIYHTNYSMSQHRIISIDNVELYKRHTYDCNNAISY